MKPVVLFCPWYGPLPEYFPQFAERVKSVGGIRLIVPTNRVSQIGTDGNVTFVPFDEADLIRRMATIDAEWKPGTLEAVGGRKLCDIRPLLADMFPEFVEGFDVWGWCDADIVMGSIDYALDRMGDADVYSTAPNQANGPLTLLRNDETCRKLYRFAFNWQSFVVADRHTAYDEVGFSTTIRSLADLGHIKFVSEYSHTHDGMDSRTVDAPGISILPDGRLFDEIQNREIAFYHFANTKAWPRFGRNQLEWHPVERLTNAPFKLLHLVFDGTMPRSVVDFGCNCGEWLEAASSFGCHDIIGVDGANMLPHLRFDRSKFRVGDLSKPFDLKRRFDLAITLEVAEHIPTEASDTFVDTLCRHADWILFSAAIVGQGGYAHINCQHPEFWREKFAARGYVEDRSLCPKFEALDIPSYYARNTTMYRKAA